MFNFFFYVSERERDFVNISEAVCICIASLVNISEAMSRGLVNTDRKIEYILPHSSISVNTDRKIEECHKASSTLTERNPPPGGVSYLLCSLIKNRV